MKTNVKIGLFLLALVIIVLMVKGTLDVLRGSAVYKKSQVKEVQGAQLVGCETSLNPFSNIQGKILNTNKYSIKVREMYRSGDGETIKSIVEIKPDEEKAVGKLRYNDAFHIYKGNELVGIIEIACP